MEVQGQLGGRPAFAEGPRQRDHLAGIGHAGGVAQGDPVRSQPVDEARAPVEHGGDRHVAFHRAAERAREQHVDHRLRLAGKRAHVRQCRERLRACHAQVGQVVCFARRHHKVELVGVGIDCAFGAAHVRHERAVDHARLAVDLAQHDLAVAQCGNRLGRHEGGDLDLRHTCLRELVHQRDLAVGRYERLFAL